MKNTRNFILQSLKIYFFGGIVSSLFLLYLVITDPYFKNLDWGWNNYKEELSKFFLFTFYIPFWLTIAYGLFLLYKYKSWTDKLFFLFPTILGTFFFCFFDSKLKKIFIFSSYIVINLVILISIYSLIFWMCFRLEYIERAILKKTTN